MYHIKNDKRSKASAEEITKGLYRCLQNAPLSTVTVSDLHRETGISRATIYRLFDTPEDVLIYQIDCMMDWIIQYHEEHRSEMPAKLFESVVMRSLENYELLEALVNNGRFDLLHEYTERSFRMFGSTFSEFTMEIDPIEVDYVLSNLAMNMVSTLSTWVKRGRVETAEQLVTYTKRFLWLMNYVTDDADGREGVTVLPHL